MPGKPRKKRTNPALDEAIDRNLSRAYMDAVNEPLPERLKDLIERLRRQEDEASSRQKPED